MPNKSYTNLHSLLQAGRRCRHPRVAMLAQATRGKTTHTPIPDPPAQHMRADETAGQTVPVGRAAKGRALGAGVQGQARPRRQTKQG